MFLANNENGGIVEEISHFHKSLKRSLNNYVHDAFAMESGQKFSNTGTFKRSLYLFMYKTSQIEDRAVTNWVYTFTWYNLGPRPILYKK